MSDLKERIASAITEYGKKAVRAEALKQTKGTAGRPKDNIGNEDEIVWHEMEVRRRLAPQGSKSVEQACAAIAAEGGVRWFQMDGAKDRAITRAITKAVTLRRMYLRANRVMKRDRERKRQALAYVDALIAARRSVMAANTRN